MYRLIATTLRIVKFPTVSIVSTTAVVAPVAIEVIGGDLLRGRWGHRIVAVGVSL
jgi:hypothetical protein